MSNNLIEAYTAFRNAYFKLIDFISILSYNIKEYLKRRSTC